MFVWMRMIWCFYLVCDFVVHGRTRRTSVVCELVARVLFFLHIDAFKFPMGLWCRGAQCRWDCRCLFSLALGFWRTLPCCVGVWLFVLFFRVWIMFFCFLSAPCLGALHSPSTFSRAAFSLRSVLTRLRLLFIILFPFTSTAANTCIDCYACGLLCYFFEYELRFDCLSAPCLGLFHSRITFS